MRRRHCTARRARRGFPTHRNGAMPARFISRVTSVDGTKRFACIEEVERGADGAGAGARVRVISAMRGGDGDEDDDGLAVFEEELVAADEEILIHFDDVDRVSRVQGRYHERGWLERESGYLESCAWVVRVREARIEHRSKTLHWAWRGEDDMENVGDAACRLVEADEGAADAMLEARMVLVSELCALPLNADGTPRRKFFRREAREFGVMLKCRKANFPRDALRNRPACAEPFYVVTSRQRFVSAITNTCLSPMRTGDEAIQEARAWSEATDTLGEPLRMRIGDAAQWMNNVEPQACVIRGDGAVLWSSGVHGARFERFGGGGGGGARDDEDDEEDDANDDMDANAIDEEACTGLSDATRVIALSNGHAVVKRLGDVRAGELLAANLSAGGEVSQWCQVMDLKREVAQTAVVGSLMHIDDADEVLSVVVGVNAMLNLTAPAQRVYVAEEDVTAYATRHRVVNWQYQDGGMQAQYDSVVLRAALSSAPSEEEALQCVNQWLANNPNIEAAPRVHNTRHALVVKVQGDEVWRVKYGPRHFGGRYVDTLNELNARVAAMAHGPAHLASAAEVFRGDSEKRARYEDDIARYEEAAPNARVALSHDVECFSLGCEGFSRHVFASLEIAAARFAREFVPDAPTFEALWSRIDVRGVVPPADAARFVTMWLGDGTKRRLEIAVATEEEPLIGGFLATLAERCGYELSVDEREDEACSSYRLVRYNGALGAESPLKVLLQELQVFEEKQVSSRAVQIFLASSRPTRLAILAGFGDTDGWRLAVRGMSAAGFSQSLRARHGSIVITYAVVAASCGFDVAYGEVYDMDTPPRRDDNGVYAFIPNDRVWEDNGFARVRKALSILNGTTSEIPFVLGYKKTPPVDRVIDGQSFVRGFSGFQFRRIRGAAISMTTLTARAAPTASSWLMDFARP